MPKEETEYQYVVRLPEDLREALMKRAEEEDRPISRIIRSALRAYLMPELTEEEQHLARIMRGG
jgi:predicted transcriptional regulator